MQAMPGTADYGYSTRPLLSGTVLSVNDHRVVVETDQGRKVAMVMDSRTMVPRDIAPGSVLRAEFKEMQDGRYYAERISLVDSHAPYREQAYAYTRDSDVSSAGILGDCESVQPSPGNAATSVSSYERGRSGDRGTDHAAAMDRSASDRDRSGSAEKDRVASGQNSSSEKDRIAANDVSGRAGTLPQTASRRPLFLLFGLLGLGSAGAITYLRLRTA